MVYTKMMRTFPVHHVSSIGLVNLVVVTIQ